jgi:WhiB family redox-sensing transcriptional regulator
MHAAPSLEPDPHSWRDRANCRGMDVNTFFPEQGKNSTAAKAVCDGCEVTEECWAYGQHQKFGVWGGRGERERRRMRYQRRRSGQGADATFA